MSPVSKENPALRKAGSNHLLSIETADLLRNQESLVDETINHSIKE